MRGGAIQPCRSEHVAPGPRSSAKDSGAGIPRRTVNLRFPAFAEWRPDIPHADRERGPARLLQAGCECAARDSERPADSAALAQFPGHEARASRAHGVALSRAPGIECSRELRLASNAASAEWLR